MANGDDAGGQGGEGGQGPPEPGAGGQDPPERAGDSGGTGGQGQQFGEAYVKQLREEAAGHRRAAKDLAARLKALEEGQLSEQQKLQRELDELKGRVPELERQVRRAQVERVAMRCGALYPEAVAPLIPAGVDVEDDQAVEAAVNALKPTYPGMFRRQRGNGAGAGDEPGGGADGGAGGGSPPAPSVNSWIRRQAGRT